ncbi:AmmeMemoRadiSam system protein B [bacterium]|nr:AmmeMemoRadiSam system protein B [bacterium]
MREASREGERVFELRDSYRLSDKSVILPLFLLLVAELLDGTRTVAEVAAEFTKRHKFPIEAQHVETLVRALDECLLLKGPRFDAALAEWRSDPVRQPFCAGRSYPGEAQALAAFLDAQYTRQGGPGGPPERDGRAAPVSAVFSPHIDFHRGGHAYAWAWRAVAESCEADTFVIFGTAHQGTDAARFALTKKNYATPLGTIETDQELVSRLVSHYKGGDDLFSGEMAHRDEHSIEFQMVELAHLYGERSEAPRKIRALPVLCGSIHDLALRGERPGDDARWRDFHDALAKALADIPRERVCFVAGVDLAHVGKDFGDPGLSKRELEAVLEKDRATLALVVNERHPDPFHLDIARDQDARRICGHSAIAATLEALRRQDGDLKGELLCHEKWYDGSSSVTFASAVYRAKARSSP